MHYDNQSPPGSWRQEILRNSPSREQLLDMVNELEHCLKVTRNECETLQAENRKLLKDLAETTALQLEAQGKNEKLKKEINHIWSVLRGECPEIIIVDEPLK